MDVGVSSPPSQETVGCLTLGEADKQVVQYEGAVENSYRGSNVKTLVWLAAYPWALEGLGK